MEFKSFKERLAAHFNRIAQDHALFEVNIDKGFIWNLYLDSFPEGTNPLYRTRREHDCSCCRHFIKSICGVVYIDSEYKVHSIFEFDAGSESFQPVMDALAAYVTTRPIVNVYLSKSDTIGMNQTYERDASGHIHTYEHLFVNVPSSFVVGDSSRRNAKLGNFRDTRNVFKRSLDEISLDAIQTVEELILSNTLYKGEEWKMTIRSLRSWKQRYDAVADDLKDAFSWSSASDVGDVLGRIRNHSIGILLTDISSGMDLDEAVRRYEHIVAPSNYKRPKPIFTKKMLENAQKAITELGYMDSLPRRFASLDDISVQNILFSNKDSAKRIAGNVFDEMMTEATQNPKRFSRVEEIAADKFISDVLPTVTEVEAFVESRHATNLVSIIAPVNKDAKPMFKWNNGFSWAYSGNVTDSIIRENVKNAGGRVDGVLRFSIQWNDIKADINDLDAHCKEPNGGTHIYFRCQHSPKTRGNLDVDIIYPLKGTPAVENITYPDKNRMLPGTYEFYVHCFGFKRGRSGFRAEIEFDGQIYKFDYAKPLYQGENVPVADVTLDENGQFSIKERLPSQTSSRELWGIKSNQFVPVSVIMYSPNYWDAQQGIGHRHYMFMLKGCVNPEQPNGFYNEFLKHELNEHRHTLEALGSKMAVASVEDQLSGLGFSSTKRNDLIVKVKGATERIFKIKF